jgi:hypothetical protein
MGVGECGHVICDDARLKETRDSKTFVILLMNSRFYSNLWFNYRLLCFGPRGAHMTVDVRFSELDRRTRRQVEEKSEKAATSRPAEMRGTCRTITTSLFVAAFVAFPVILL